VLASAPSPYKKRNFQPPAPSSSSDSDSDSGSTTEPFDDNSVTVAASPSVVLVRSLKRKKQNRRRMHASDYSAKERLDWHQLVDERGAVYYRNSKTEREQDSMPVCGVTNDPDPDANLAVRDTVHPQRVAATGAAATGAAAAGVAAWAAAVADETVYDLPSDVDLEAETQEHVSPRLQGRTLSGGIGGTPIAGLSPPPSARRKRGASQPTEAAPVRRPLRQTSEGRRVRRAKADLIRMKTRPGWAAGPQGQAAAARAKAEFEKALEEAAIDFDDPNVRRLHDESPSTQEDSDPEATQPMDDSPGPPYRFGPSSMLQAANEFDFTRDPI
jgi:hypothetical protein